MSKETILTRRALIKGVAVSALASAFSKTSLGSAAESPTAAVPGSRLARDRGLKLGVATISIKDLPVASAAEVLRQLELSEVGVFRSHGPFEKGTPEQCAEAANTFRAAGLHVATSSVVNLTTDEAAMRRAFENAKAAGLELMTIRPTPDCLALLERFVKEYNLRVAIHNHGPEDELYPTPADAWAKIEKLDARIGLCIDAGHTARAGADPAEAIRRYATRLYDFHIKDSLAEVGAKKDIPTEVGRGRVPIRSILHALEDVKYAGAVLFEYERMGVNPVVGLAESVGYVRGVLAGRT